MLSSGGRRAGRGGGRAAGAWSVLSGPAGGAVGAGLLARLSGDANALGFDMGGTSCDVCVIEDGRVRKTGLARARRPGRSSCRWSTCTRSAPAAARSAGATTAARCGSGPRSAGAEPGPACYGRGGSEPTVTDANLLLGYLERRLGAGRRRRARRRGGRRRAVARLARRARARAARGRAEGIVRVANQEMVRALRVVTVERGVDPRGFALMPFGGAGPMHAAAIAAELGIERILCPRASGVLSALGLLASERRRDTARTVMLRGGELTAERIAAEVAALREAARARGSARPRAEVDLRAALSRPGVRARGRRRRRGPSPSGSPRRSPPSTSAATATATPTAEVELVERPPGAVEPGAEPAPARRRRRARSSAARRRARFDGEWLEAEVLRGEPPAGTEAEGPCVFELPEATLVLPPGWRARGRRGRARSSRSEADERRPRPVSLQVLVGALRAACDEMGAVLIRSAHSPNIKERRDCSTALFDAARRAGDAGRAHPGPPRLDARRGRRRARARAAPGRRSGSSTTPTAAAPTCPTSP